MPNTVRENILTELRNTLATITTGNGYANTFANVQRFDHRVNPLAQTPCIILGVPDENKDPSPNPFYRCSMRVIVSAWVCQEESDTTPTDVLLSSLLGDIEKCVMQDITRGGHAIKTDLKSNESFDGVEGQPYAGIAVEIEIEYQHRQTDPTAAE